MSVFREASREQRAGMRRDGRQIAHRQLIRSVPLSSFPTSCLMANRTAKEAQVVHGTNPQYLVEKIIRTRIYESRYWKEECFGLSAADVFEKAIGLRFIGGTYGGNIKPSPFLCLTLKMLQIQPEKDIIIQFIGKMGETYKYVRALGAYYLRLTASSLDNWKYLDPLYNDFRKLRVMDKMGRFSVVHMDEFVDQLLRDERVFDVILPRISKRRVHEEANELDPRISALEEDIHDADCASDSDADAKAEQQEKEKKEKKGKVHKHKRKERKRSSSHSPDRRDRRDRDKEEGRGSGSRRSGDRNRSGSRERRPADRSRSEKEHRHASRRHRSRSR